MTQINRITSKSHTVTTVAIYGNYEPFFFKGYLMLKTFYEDYKSYAIDVEKTSTHFIRTIFYETNKIIRTRENDAYNEPLHLVVEPSSLFSAPYYVVYNKTAYPGKKASNHLSFLSDNDRQIQGLALIIKRQENGLFTWLEEKEARQIEKTMRAILNIQ